ncbi:RagB/SusD family nutrient uptake outer membrane protein [Zunongwangia endophytica]|uniref:RagB/SusD family nutrient uptake outer membrane protein n=1 Tax=Zunongwangia endophytica TaxID=1808945 RepID=A0ABV8HBW0_9FLAO|nr:RagB/SusD family nutrient uptake outer membrane protein [Zunongwangia endophytica]MDN3594832.1 RagB/SusD family nutrient uptake outer membrane protein [Zunongwangia endophytica]
MKTFNIKNLNSLYLLAFVLMVSSCSDEFLQEKQDWTGVNEQVFQDELRARAYVDYVYSLFLPNDGNVPQWWYHSHNDDLLQTSDEYYGQTRWNQEWATISPNEYHAWDYIGRKMTSKIENTTYTRIRQINLFINNVDDYDTMDEDAKNYLKGQMYFWRGYQYLDLASWYGGVPIELEAQNPIVDPAGQTSRSSAEETLGQAMSDLDMAKQLLPGRWSDAADWGRVTSGTAAALKGRAALLWASPQFNRDDEQERWQSAYEVNLEARNILEANGFDLFQGEWADIWDQEVGNPEAVWVWSFNTITNDRQMNSGWETVNRPSDQPSFYQAKPTKQTVDAFPMKDGKPIGESDIYDYDIQNFYKNRDPRFYATFVFPGDNYPYAEDPDYRSWNYTWFSEQGIDQPNEDTDDAANASGFYVKKMTNSDASNSDRFTQSGNDYIELRFAEVVLNLAESAIGINNLEEGKQGIMEIRERAGLENLDGSFGLADVNSRDELFGAVVKERQVELAYERQKRYYTLKRWMLFNDDFGTCTRLGLDPIDGTRRTGFYFIAQDENGDDYIGTDDPFEPNGEGIAPVVNREPNEFPEGISNQDEYADWLRDNYFRIQVRDNLDPTDNNWTFSWYNEYYFLGIYQDLIDTNPYLEQTVGWGGTFDPLN